MKRLLSILLILILLSSAICSCHSSRQTVTEYADTASVTTVASSVTFTKEDFFSILSATRDMELSGIRVEFYRPDSAHPDARAAPSSLTIENAKAKESAGQITAETAAVDSRDSVNIQSQSSAYNKRCSKTHNDVLKPSDGVVTFAILSAIIISVIFILIKFRS